MSKSTKQLTINALVATLYVVMTSVFSFMSFGPVQFRLAEILNHLIIWDRKYAYGILGGVFLSNALFMFSSGLGWYDLIFGVGHSALSLALTTVLIKLRDKTRDQLLLNALSFGLCSFMIGLELHLALHLPFWESYFFVAVGEVVTMGVGAFIMPILDRKISFARLLN
ncbi:QueT transporter family protein [Atopobacter sp. AH10]|uniref:QueT transporter family protein n=1 Tax=Atopobacter sp. AH10 TaxID=2315861 RepID=UPI000EF1D4D0|nr:QueT transporter family protein [Atopobacter sp. AH10]RLK62890.1 QueT transporter family protein [Atopobacter sp. AH10]